MYSHLIIITRAQINHDMLIPEQKEALDSVKDPRSDYEPIEEHDGARIVQLIHLDRHQPLWFE